jgi:hypothetical protein
MEKKAHKLRVKQIRSQLKEIGVRNAMYYFAVKFPEYRWDDRESPEFNRIDNLWYGKIIDKDFLVKLESFLKYKQVEFED